MRKLKRGYRRWSASRSGLLAEPLDMSLPAVMQHLQVLEDSGLVRSEKVGRTRTCRIEPKTLALAERWITERRLFWERNLDRLGDFLATEPEPERTEKKPRQVVQRPARRVDADRAHHGLPRRRA